MNEGIENVKAGDQVVCTDGWSGLSLAVVGRVTATQIVVGKSRYSRSTGRAIGATGYRTPWIRLPRGDDIVTLRVQAVTAKLHNLRTRLSKTNAHIFVKHLRALEADLATEAKS